MYRYAKAVLIGGAWFAVAMLILYLYGQLT